MLALVLLAFSPVVYSYVTTMMRPSSLPLGVRSVEWVRANGGAGVVNQIEAWYYGWTAPKQGGPALKTLPKVGAGKVASSASKLRGAKHTAGKFSSYHPARIAPAIHPALPREGAWQPIVPAVQGASPVLVTAFRSEAAYPRNVAYVAWIDHSRTNVALYPGRYEPPSGSPRGPMQVPYGQRWRLLATFNSGFTYRDGHGGFFVGGHSYEPLQQGLGTLVGYKDGRVDLISWRGGAVPGPRVAFARQNLPLIVDRSRPNRSLSDSSVWGATLGNAIRVWRSGVGIDAHGNLIYAAADYQTVGSLAAILIRAGAVRAIELDINNEWPTFNAYARSGARDPTKVVPNVQQAATRYLVPDDRDFFAIFRRVPGVSGAVPFS